MSPDSRMDAWQRVKAHPIPVFTHWSPAPAPAAGAGKNGPKQYERIAGQPMVWHTLAAFAAVRAHRPDAWWWWRPATASSSATRTSALVVPCGGATRAASVANGLYELGRVGRDRAATGCWCTTPRAA